MTNYNGRRGPNVSQYLRDLNTISPRDAAVVDETFMEDDFSIFTNTQFFDFETGQQTDFQAQPVKLETAAPTPTTSTPEDLIGDGSSLDFMSGDFSFGDFSSYQTPTINSFTPDATHTFAPIQPNQHSIVYPAQTPAQFPQATPQTGEKRRADTTAVDSTQSLEDTSRQAAEEDKRRRNTAASARFRIKKKQREQALEKSAKEMTDKVASLESKVSQLETENKWLKNLLVDKNGGSGDINALWNEFTKNAGKRTKPQTASDDR